MNGSIQYFEESTLFNKYISGNEEERLIFLFTKLPILDHNGYREQISNLNQTFEQLRVAKLTEFPELKCGIQVSWEVVYGEIRKMVAEPEKTEIGSFIRFIEMSKEFRDFLKDEKNKSPDCFIRPHIVMLGGCRQLRVTGLIFSAQMMRTKGRKATQKEAGNIRPFSMPARPAARKKYRPARVCMIVLE